MTLESNPDVKTQLENLEFQFGRKAMLDLDDYCALFKTCREKAGRHMKERGVPSLKIGQDVYIPVLEFALFLARKKAEREGRIIVIPEKKPSALARKAHEAQLLGDLYTIPKR